MSDDLRIPVVEETAHVFKREGVTDRVTVSTGVDLHETHVDQELMRGEGIVTRLTVDREITAVPPIRTEGDVTIVPVVEERLIVEKRLFLVEELNLTRKSTLEQVAVPVTLRRTRVDIDRADLRGADPVQQETH